MEHTRVELYEMAKTHDIKGRAKMNKEELYMALKKKGIFSSSKKTKSKKLNSSKKSIKSESPRFTSPRTFINERKYFDDFSEYELRQVAEMLDIKYWDKMDEKELYDILIGPDLDLMNDQQLIETCLLYGIYAFRESKKSIILKVADKIQKYMFDLCQLTDDELVSLMKEFSSNYYENADRNHLIFKIIKKSFDDVPIHSLKYRKLNIPYTEMTFYDTDHPPFKIRQVLHILEKIQKQNSSKYIKLDHRVFENPLYYKLLENELKDYQITYY